jgi:flagellar secretion chaperone FliS
MTDMDKMGRYLRNQVMSASPGELILMLYDEGIRSLKKAEAAFELDTPERFQEISNSLLHAQDVITELSISLDMEKGGEIASSLQSLYDFMLRHLSLANAEKNPQPVVEVRGLLGDLRESWRHAVEKSLETAGRESRPEPVGQRILAAG